MGKWIAFCQKKVSYSICGSGPAIVLLHGFLEDKHIWNKLSVFLKDQFTVVCIDLPGFGQSENHTEVHPMPLMADAVNEVLEAERISQCVLVGHSMGGYVSLAFARKYPAKLNGLVLFHSQAAADGEEGKDNRNRTIKVVQSNHKSYVSSFIPSLFAEKSVDKFQNEITQLKETSEQASLEGVCAALAGMRDRDDQLGLLKTIDKPVFFIIGKQDSKISMNTIWPQLELPRNCEALILDGVGHMGFIEAEEITSRAIKHFAERMNE